MPERDEAPSTRVPERWIAFERCRNFRDIGGYRTVDGRTVRWGRVFRSASPDKMSERDAAKAHRELGVRTVFDLREDREKSPLDAPLLLPAAVRSVHASLNRPVDGTQPPPANRHLGDVYLWMLEGVGPALAHVLRSLAEEPALPALVHCQGGKDRTGIVIGTVLALLGVPDKTITADYALTDSVMVAMMAEDPDVIAGVRRLGYPKEILRARPTSMARFLAGVRDRHGSVEGLARDIGVPDEEVRELRRLLLE